MEKRFQNFQLKSAYEFLQSNGLSRKATEIRRSKAKVRSYDSMLRRAVVLAVLTRNRLLDRFIAERWPDADTPRGQSERNRLNKIYRWHQRYKTLTCDQIKEAVKKYNDGPSLRKDGFALRKSLAATRSLTPCLGRFVAEVWVIADWGSIEFFSFEDRFAMAEEIDARWVVLQAMIGLRDRHWGAETKIMAGLVDDLAQQTHLLPTPGVKKRQLSFLSKYLHFCVNDAFPLWDKNARQALGGDEDPTWGSYKKWLNRVHQEVETHKVCLRQVQQRGESLVRTLDKALYTIGSELPPLTISE